MKQLPKTRQIKFRIEKMITKKGVETFFKWESYYNSFNMWINMKYLT